MMQNKVESVYCQKCLAANPLGQELCARCGTRLMLVVAPSAVRYEEETTETMYDEHLLERVSALENRIARIAERLEEGLDLLLRQAQNTYFDHTLLDTLIGALDEARVINRRRLDDLWRERCRADAAERDASDRRESLRSLILARRSRQENKEFERLVKEGFDLLNRGDMARGIRALERAAALDTEVAPLNVFLGEHFFRLGRTALARDYLARAFVKDASNPGLCLLLGLVYGDEGEPERARELLRSAIQQGGASFAAYYALGRLLAADGKWSEALEEFKRALAARPCPEASYVVGFAYFQLGRDRMAARYLRKAIEADAQYAAAHHLLGLVLLRSGETERAREELEAAYAADADDPRYRAAARRFSRSGEIPAIPPLFGATRVGRRLVTGGDKRLAEALRVDALIVAAERGRAALTDTQR
jgi:tetratricopeptide (TPR) repeat protein